jgi:ATP-binding cassette subfamily C (CFTR/MRP) protein 4
MVIPIPRTHFYHFIFIFANVSAVAEEDVGLAISSTLVLSGIFQWGMRQSAETENLMTSVERALEYSRLESEGNLVVKNAPQNWPKGAIRFESVSLSYNGTEDVLKNLSFEIKAKEKIGIVGRTGKTESVFNVNVKM